MIHNKICPYCIKTLNKTENDPLCRSREHMIPHVALTSKRDNGQADFYVCRTCNLRKSNIDYVLGVVSKFQSNDESLAIGSIQKALDNPKRNKRFIDMIVSAQVKGQEIHMRLPITGTELSNYIDFLAKGQYFKTTDYMLSMKNNLVTFEFIDKRAIAHLESGYKKQHGSYPIKDLQKNPNAETIAGGECVIYSQKGKYIFFFQEGLAFIVEIKRRNKTNERKKAEYIKQFSA